MDWNKFSIKKPTKDKKDRSVIPMLAVALVFFVLAAAPMAWGLGHTFKYRNYMKDLRDEFIKGERFGTITAEYEGEVYSVAKMEASRIFQVVNYAGMGRTCDSMETEFSEWTLIDLGHGSTLFLAPTRMIIEYEEEVSGLYVEYTFNNGKKYCYETDDTQFYHIRNILRDIKASSGAESSTAETAYFSGIDESQIMDGQILLYGENRHSNTNILNQELEIWGVYYNDYGMRHLFIEDNYYGAAFLNLWMKEPDDEILDQLFIDIKGTQADSPDVKNFFKTIKEKYPETVFHGIDVGHQYESTGQRYLKYLAENGFAEDSEEYTLTKENIDQGKTFYRMSGHAYRETKMAENFIREYDALNGERVMGIFGDAHTDPHGMNYYTGEVPTMAGQLVEKYGDDVKTQTLYRSPNPLYEEEIDVNGKTYIASYFGEDDLTAYNPGTNYKSQKIWRLEDAYDDFKNLPVTDNVLPISNYPTRLEIGQVFLIEYTMGGGSTFTQVMRFDGDYWQGSLTTVEVDLD